MKPTDELTQLATRAHLLEFIAREWLSAIRDRTSIALMILDVDFFERFNDTHGHDAGDACLRRIAAVIDARIRRSSDLVARYGGEEFAVVLAGAEEAGALGVAHWIRAEIEKQQIPHGASSVCDYVTVSIGIGVFAPKAGDSSERLIAGADAALYRAKELGRNAVIANSSGEPHDLAQGV
jgi:diguanylate cyclase (GGDEF)-like protein